MSTPANAAPTVHNPKAISLVLIAAIGENGVIGQNGGLPWRLKSDMVHFRNITMNKPVVMGRKTWASIGKPLAGRTNIVITRDGSFSAPGVVVTSSVATAVAIAHGDALRRSADGIAVIGGADIFAATMACADRLVITHIHAAPAGDTTFPDIDLAVWRETARSEHAAGPGDDAAYAIAVYERRPIEG